MLNAASGRRAAGFTLIEVIAVLAIGAILAVIGVPAAGKWMREARIRTAAESLRDGLRAAQSKALQSGRQTVLVLTANQVSSATSFATLPTPAANSAYWYVAIMRLLDTDGASFVTAGIAGDPTGGVSITGPAVACFSPLGRLTTTSADALVTCPSTLTAILDGTGLRYDFTARTGDRALRVTVGSGGQVRLCDPSRTAPTDTDRC